MIKTPVGESFKSKLWIALLTSGCAMALTPAAAAAQDGAGDENRNETIVVTVGRAVAATKTDTPLTEIPQAISVITSQEIEDRSVQDFQDVFRYSPGVSAADSVDSRGDFVVSRGFDASQYLDGLKRMPSFIYGARLEPFTLERAEILRGPSSVLYGAGGPGGVLNAVSKRPQFTMQGEAGIGGGTDDRVFGKIDVTGPLADNFAVRFVGFMRDGETQWGTPDDRMVINPSIRWQPTPDTDITLIGLWQEDKQGSLGFTPLSKTYFEADDPERLPFNFYQGEPGFNGMDTDYLSATLQLDHQFTDKISFHSITRYTEMDTDYKEIYNNYTQMPFADAAETQLQREFYVNDEYSKVFNTDNNILVDFETGPLTHKVLLGANYTWFEQTKSEGFSCGGFCYPGGPPPPLDVYALNYGQPFDFGATVDSDNSSSEFGVYIQDQISYADRVHVVLGVRHDQAKSKANGVEQFNQKAWSFRGGIIAEVFAGISPYFNYAESFLPVAGTNFVGDAFSPRNAVQYEGGVKWEPMLGALFSVAYFDIVEDNYISQDPTNIQNFLQGGSVGSKGVEVEASIRKPNNYEIVASYTHVEATVTESSTTLVAGDRIAFQPNDLASLWASKTLLFGDDWRVRIGGGVRYKGKEIGAMQRFVNPDVTLVDAFLSVGKGPWELSVTGSNILNERYYDECAYYADAATGNAGYCIAAKDRTINASLTRRF